MQKTILWIVILIVVAGGAYLLLSTPAEAPSIEPADEMMEDGAMMEDGTIMEEEAMMGDAPFAVLVSNTGEGFTPVSVTVKKGETVRFVNDASTEDIWPASAVHPTHSVYPEKSSNDCLGSAFDACHGLKPGEFWEFTFNEVGEWRYHDHLHASKTGVVTVTE